MAYVTATHALRKVFVSIKGVSFSFFFFSSLYYLFVVYVLLLY